MEGLFGFHGHTSTPLLEANLQTNIGPVRFAHFTPCQHLIM